MIKIYHNPRCTKSRQGVAFLEDKGLDFEIVKYLENTFTVESLTEMISELGVKPIELVRKNEAIWKSDFKGKELSNTEIIQAMVDFPKLIERPIVVNHGKAVVARPTEKIEEVL
ncbi:arsenate reductase (glutaredoxin) [Wenyingzhuangia sp. chi5]|uniref:Arsenate reductase (Glutaredoxin) n=1 Tax=Wenyingzhuangia gilva TaxID=3057677 RepID=A0ABT8VQY3_9FLAO|nr:arsenate reductase (glutaredoxin) [Wenyingzhuangia sp. chi5]MDO3694379.1 arsenate reductase (glutaredoxin) [Wenyingzhuangia sp. chi5]